MNNNDWDVLIRYLTDPLSKTTTATTGENPLKDLTALEIQHKLEEAKRMLAAYSIPSKYSPPTKKIEKTDTPEYRNRLTLKIMNVVINKGGWSTKISPDRRPSNVFMHSDMGKKYGFTTEYDMVEDRVILRVRYKTYEDMKLTDMERYDKLQSDVALMVQLFNLTEANASY